MKRCTTCPIRTRPRHPKGRGNGYVLTFGNERIYISGDTDDIPEMRAHQHRCGLRVHEPAVHH
ncbi:MAG: hypothetical protein IPO87_05545 [Flavobacteriales bacterium]|nr:hypothetical protein [Flavobacteriales bacterium]